MLRLLKECLWALPILAFCNMLLIWEIQTNGALPYKIMLTIVLSLWYLVSMFRIYRKNAGSRRLAMISHGLRMLRYTMICMVLQIPVVLIVYFSSLFLPYPRDWYTIGMLIGNLLFFAFFAFAMALSGLLRLGIAARQVKWYWYPILFFVWWMPLVNLLPLLRMYHVAERELAFETARLELDAVRKENEICSTKYPILMVHGIFFRDWQFFNYWGRIPAALKKNGAAVYYGKQQSAQSIAESAAELNAQIQAILAESGAEKLNIIAHSKGGLDARYAIAELGAAPYVASLTTINTPHHGCAWVDGILRRISPSMAEWIAARYEKIFRGLGDKSPDFLGGIRDLTAESCKAFNEKYPIHTEIPHHCIMSEMCSVLSAPFPLWLGYLCNRFVQHDARNDGLVSVSSARLEGVPFTFVRNAGLRGISHGDMIDLNRENIAGFDVREFYVNIVKKLKEQGL